MITKNLSVFIVAEISANHAHNFNRAVALIKKAKQCGADAVKFQTYTPDTMTIDCQNRHFRVKHPAWGGQTLYQLYKQAYTPWRWFKQLKRISDDLGLVFFSTAFDQTAVDFLEELAVPLHKIASFELVDLPLVEYAARTKKPLIISTGMAKVCEIKAALNTAKAAGAEDIVLLKCVSSYPAKPEEMNLRTIADMRKMFNCPIGLSDHSLGIGVSLAAVALGAKVIEKHFSLSAKLRTPDSFFSLDPRRFKQLVENIRIAEAALGRVHYGLTAEEKKNLVFRRSLFVIKDMRRGELFSTANVRSIRPAGGLAPRYLSTVLGKRARRNIKKGTPLSFKMISGK